MLITDKDKSVYGIERIFNKHTNKEIARLIVTGNLIVFKSEPFKIYTGNYNEVIQFVNKQKLDYFLEIYNEKY